MKLYHDLHPAGRETAVAIGVFDGLHLGHRRVIGAAIGRGASPAVFTFETDILRDGKRAPVLLTQERKVGLLAEMGVELCWAVPFAAIHEMEARDFARDVLAGVCRATTVCCGYNFRFGRGGLGTAEALASFGREFGFRVCVTPPVEAGGRPVSSTRIRALIAEGEIEEANGLLGRPFSYAFPVVHGRQLGRQLGFPTINQNIPVNGCAVVTMTAETSALRDSLEDVVDHAARGPGVLKCEILAG